MTLAFLLAFLLSGEMLWFVLPFIRLGLMTPPEVCILLSMVETDSPQTRRGRARCGGGGGGGGRERDGGD